LRVEIEDDLHGGVLLIIEQRQPTIVDRLHRRLCVVARDREPELRPSSIEATRVGFEDLRLDPRAGEQLDELFQLTKIALHYDR
jgi:hypothetical protein